jgi:hypothetical protein
MENSSISDSDYYKEIEYTDKYYKIMNNYEKIVKMLSARIEELKP